MVGRWNSFEMRMVGILPWQIRSSMRLDVLRSSMLSIMATTLLFIPAVLGRLGASAD